MRGLSKIMNVVIPAEMYDWVDAQIKNGRFTSPNQYIKDLIKNDQVETNISRILFFIKLALIEEEINGEKTLNVDEIIKREIKKLARSSY
jgi:Arc/MetJ-type ribon-helix-helix transcriptional regulator